MFFGRVSSYGRILHYSATPSRRSISYWLIKCQKLSCESQEQYLQLPNDVNAHIFALSLPVRNFEEVAFLIWRIMGIGILDKFWHLVQFCSSKTTASVAVWWGQMATVCAISHLGQELWKEGPWPTICVCQRRVWITKVACSMPQIDEVMPEHNGMNIEEESHESVKQNFFVDYDIIWLTLPECPIKRSPIGVGSVSSCDGKLHAIWWGYRSAWWQEISSKLITGLFGAPTIDQPAMITEVCFKSIVCSL